ncbi:MAG: hypothetical protein GC201_11280 [Alphaproteobacteria bacterium]|nr:hypothetical protein [Alphaproteobacteria bacterium]
MSRTAIRTVLAALVALIASPALAASSVTVSNGWSRSVNVAVFDGAESRCQLRDAGSKATVPAGKSKAFACKDQGKNRCRVTILEPGTSGRYCQDVSKGCKGKAVTVADGGRISLSGSGETPKCAIGNDSRQVRRF